MRKLVTLFILAAMVFTLAGCAGLAAKTNQEETAAVATPVPSPTPDLSDILAASASNAETASQNHTPPASASNAQVDQTGYQKALECVGHSVQELYDAVGQPVEPATYGPSCLQEGAEDGMLSYNGFYVWTVRTETEETVQEVYLDN